jgi:hypothetical protein
MDSIFAVSSAGLLACVVYAGLLLRSLAKENASLKAQLAKFDHDGDGKPGGSKRRI